MSDPLANVDTVRWALECDAIRQMRDGNTDGLLRLLLHPSMQDEHAPLSQTLREWLVGFLEGGPEFGFRLTLTRHPNLKHNPEALKARDNESAKGIDAVVAFLNSGGLTSSKKGIGAAQDATGWSRTKVTNFLTGERIKAMREASEKPELDIDPVGAGLGLKLPSLKRLGLDEDRISRDVYKVKLSAIPETLQCATLIDGEWVETESF